MRIMIRGSDGKLLLMRDVVTGDDRDLEKKTVKAVLDVLGPEEEEGAWECPRCQGRNAGMEERCPRCGFFRNKI